MKFGLFIHENEIPEWKDFYVNYDCLVALLHPLAVQNKIYMRRHVMQYSELSESDLERQMDDKERLLDMQPEEELKIQKHFDEQLLAEQEKVEFFFTQNLLHFRRRLEKIKVNYGNQIFRTKSNT